LRGGSNLFAYAPNPLGWVDPFGLANKQNKPECPCPDKKGKWDTPENWAEKDHAALRDKLRVENQGYESGRHNEYPRAMRRELEALADKADAEGVLPEYGQRLRKIADTYRKREGAAHRGGR
jgi:uncharacterized protein RhaS with RHS repeats